jgi:hypothetical protein
VIVYTAKRNTTIKLITKYAMAIPEMGKYSIQDVYATFLNIKKAPFFRKGL